jgi:large subunit ribosomal protein L7/L12
MPIEELTCPNCGATLDLKAGAATAVCKYCNTPLRLVPQVAANASPAAPELDERTDPYRDLADKDRIKELLRDRRQQDAIRLYMEQTGASLKEAQQAIADMAFDAGLATLPTDRGPYAVDLDKIKQLLDRGNKIAAIKLLREQTHLGLKAAKDAVEALERGEMLVITTNQRQGEARPIGGAAGRLGCFIGCLPVLGIIAACVIMMGLAGQVMFRAWGPYDQAMAMVRESEEVNQVFGGPLHTGLMIFGGIESDSSSDSDANFEVPLYGSKMSGTLRVIGHWRKNVWDVSVWVLYDRDNEEQTIYLNDKRK